jgi:hypothetical protein
VIKGHGRDTAIKSLAHSQATGIGSSLSMPMSASPGTAREIDGLWRVTREIRRLCRAAGGVFLKRWWRRGWYPITMCACFAPSEQLGRFDPQKIIVDGKIGRLTSRCIISLTEISNPVNNQPFYIDIVGNAKEGKRWRLGDALLRPAFRFFATMSCSEVFWKDSGLYVAATAAFYVFLKYAKL